MSKQPPIPKQFMVKEPPMPKSFQGSFNLNQQPVQNQQDGGMGGMMGAGAEPTQQDQQNFLKNMTDEQLLKLVEQDPKLKEAYQKILSEQKLNPQGNTKPLTSIEYNKLKSLDSLLDKEGGIVIEPDQGFVLKTYDLKTKEKFFINVLKHPIIDEPEEKYLVDLENQPGLRIPMSVGRLKEDHDKKGEICKVVDAIINPVTCDSVQKESQLKMFFQELITTYLAEKYKIQLDIKSYTSPNLKYKGKSIEFQRVKGKKGPKITQLSEEEIKTEKEIQKQGDRIFKEQGNKSSIIPEMIPRPKWKLFCIYDDFDEEYDGNFNIQDIKQFRYDLEMPLLMTGTKIDVQIRTNNFNLKVGSFYQLLLKFPMKVDPTTAQGYFNTKNRTFHIIVRPNVQNQIQNNANHLDAIDSDEEIEIINKQKENAQLNQSKKVAEIQLENDLLDDLF